MAATELASPDATLVPACALRSPAVAIAAGAAGAGAGADGAAAAADDDDDDAADAVPVCWAADCSESESRPELRRPLFKRLHNSAA